MKAGHDKRSQRGTELLWHKREEEMFSFKEGADYFLSCMSECLNQDHSYYNVVFNISKEFESSACVPQTIVHWNIFKSSPCSCLVNPFPFIIYMCELLCYSAMQMWGIKHKVKHFCWSKLLSDRGQVMFTVHRSYHLKSWKGKY